MNMVTQNGNAMISAKCLPLAPVGQSTPSPELADFLELVGREMAREWIRHLEIELQKIFGATDRVAIIE